MLLEEADSDYAMFAYHDDILSLDCIATLAAVLDANPEVVLSYSDVLLTILDGKQKYLVFSVLEGEHNSLRRGAKMLLPVNDKW